MAKHDKCLEALKQACLSLRNCFRNFVLWSSLIVRMQNQMISAFHNLHIHQFIGISSSFDCRVKLTKSCIFSDQLYASRIVSDQLYASKIKRSYVLKLLFDFISHIQAVNKFGYTLRGDFFICSSQFLQSFIRLGVFFTS